MPLLERAQAKTVEASEMTIMEHLQALRRVLIITFGSFALFTLIAAFFSRQLADLLITRAGLPKAYYTTPVGGVVFDLEIALFVGALAAVPIVVQQIWWFVGPGLHLHERRLLLPIVVATVVFFYMGAGVAGYTLPLFLRILGSLAPSNLLYLPVGGDLLTFILIMVIAFGVVFEMPVILYTLGRLGIISSKWLYKNRLYWIIGLAVLANLLTPGVDPVTPFILFIPLYIFWEGTTLLLKLGGH